jgi:hypothetical protein
MPFFVQTNRSRKSIKYNATLVITSVFSGVLFFFISNTFFLHGTDLWNAYSGKLSLQILCESDRKKWSAKQTNNYLNTSVLIYLKYY